MSWKENFSFLSKNSDFIEMEVKGQTLRFYTLSVAALFSLRAMAEPLAKLLTALFRDRSKDVAQEQIRDGERLETRIQAIDPELARQLDSERRKAIEGLILLLTNQDTASSLGMLLFDSLRDLRPENYGRREALEFIRSLDLETLKQMLRGLAKANEGVLGPLAEELRTKVVGLSEADELADEANDPV
jgi:hypothetical protein